MEDDDSNDDDDEDDEDDDDDDSDGDDDGSDDVDDIDALVESGLAGRRRLQPRSRRNSPFSLSSFTQQTITSINTKILNICESSFKNTNTSELSNSASQPFSRQCQGFACFCQNFRV